MPAGERDAEGDAAVARALESLPEGWVVLHDLVLAGRQRLSVDHVVIGPAGVFVVDVKSWPGHIEVRDRVLLQDGRRREQAVASATAAAAAVQSVVTPVRCTGVLCFVREEPLATSSYNVTVCSTGTLVAAVTSGPSVLGPAEVQRCAEAISAATEPRRVETAVPSAASLRARKVGRVVSLVAGVLLLAALAVGGYRAATGWSGEHLTNVIVPGGSTPTTPSEEPAQDQDRTSQR